MSAETFLVRLLIFLVIAIGGLAMVGAGVNMVLNERADVQQAATVEGTVGSTDVKYEGSVVSTADSPATGGYKPVVRYTYTYDGQEYTSDSVYPGPEKQFNSEDVARSVATQVSPGQTVTVYVNRRNPSRAFLINETGGNPEPFFLMGIGALVAVPFLLAVKKEIVRGLNGS